ncbi:hypothetical protein GALMADRAFT_148228 [Galerina marginata CBS 339.88]|uniref:Uncharacterized protein n=1 Tax=Galerina marginata (strain CBS 339.88) TaxID=685588 RepID=A0A067SGU6_GALM3|nr:hypothetical protein GALMADRAFT_148228 [Galerina marginata CBS 339.88]
MSSEAFSLWTTIPKRVGLVRPRDSANRVAFRKWHQPHQQPSMLLILTFNHHHLPLSPDLSLNTPRNVGFHSTNERKYARCHVASPTLPNLRVVGHHSGSGIAQQGDREEGETQFVGDPPGPPVPATLSPRTSTLSLPTSLPVGANFDVDTRPNQKRLRKHAVHVCNDNQRPQQYASWYSWDLGMWSAAVAHPCAPGAHR